MREWLIALGILVIVAVLLDVVRRIRRSQRDSLQLAAKMTRGMDPTGLDMFDDEQSISAARVVANRGDMDDSAYDDDAEDVPRETGNLLDTGRRNTIDLGQTVPLLMDVKETHRIEPGFESDMDDASADDILDEGRYSDEGLDDESSVEDMQRLSASREEDDIDAPPARKPFSVPAFKPVLDSAATPLVPGESEIISAPRVFERPADRPPPRREPPVIKASKPVVKAQQERALKMQQQEQEQEQLKTSQQLPLEDVIIVSVMARDRGGFPGANLLEVLLDNGLRYGHRNIFHRYIGEEREDESLYKVAKAVKPGTFDLSQMESFNTPGVTLFMPLPTPGTGRMLDAFESMLGTARNIAEKLNGELRDDNRSVMTAQTIEHCRQRIMDFEMQSRLRAR